MLSLSPRDEKRERERGSVFSPPLSLAFFSSCPMPSNGPSFAPCSLPLAFSLAVVEGRFWHGVSPLSRFMPSYPLAWVFKPLCQGIYVPSLPLPPSLSLHISRLGISASIPSSTLPTLPSHHTLIPSAWVFKLLCPPLPYPSPRALSPGYLSPYALSYPSPHTLIPSRQGIKAPSLSPLPLA